MKTLFVLTDPKHFPWHSDDAGLAEAFEALDIEAQPIVWESWDPPPQAKVLIRTPWDYALKSEAFLKLLRTIDERGGTLFNDYQSLLWNLDKSYMLDLAAGGAQVVPTRVERKLQITDEFLESLTYPCVLKPLVGCAGRDTFLVTGKDHVLATALVLEGQDVMVQPYIPEIVSEGEYSFMYFNGEFSHAVLKTAAQGEFRVQDDHGGKVAKYEPTPKEVQAGKDILTATGKVLPYARVDFVRSQGVFLLMELELIEPELFFRFSENGTRLFSQALSSQL